MRPVVIMVVLCVWSGVARAHGDHNEDQEMSLSIGLEAGFTADESHRGIHAGFMQTFNERWSGGLYAGFLTGHTAGLTLMVGATLELQFTPLASLVGIAELELAGPVPVRALGGGLELTVASFPHGGGVAFALLLGEHAPVWESYSNPHPAEIFIGFHLHAVFSLEQD